jgi:uncharacterized membrane protein YkvA (DUF1232 family)
MNRHPYALLLRVEAVPPPSFGTWWEISCQLSSPMTWKTLFILVIIFGAAMRLGGFSGRGRQRKRACGCNLLSVLIGVKKYGYGQERFRAKSIRSTRRQDIFDQLTNSSLYQRFGAKDMRLSKCSRDWITRFSQDLEFYKRVLNHPDTPRAAKLLLGFAVTYAASPIDLIPDFIPVVGYLDDLLILPLLIWISLRLIPKTVIMECRQP